MLVFSLIIYCCIGYCQVENVFMGIATLNGFSWMILWSCQIRAKLAPYLLCGCGWYILSTSYDCDKVGCLSLSKAFMNLYVYNYTNIVG